MTSRKTKTRFNYVPTTKTPPLGEIKIEWDLATLYYKNDRDKRIELDLRATEEAFLAFAKKWKRKPFATDDKLLQKALTEYEALSANPTFSRPARYFWLRSCLDVNDSLAEQKRALIVRRLRKASDEILFFSLTLGQIPDQEQLKLLKKPQLKHFHYHLERLFRGAKHNLTEPEEKIINLKGPQSYGMWVDMTDKIISNRTVNWKGKSLHLPAAIEEISALQFKDKNRLWLLILKELKQIGEVAEHEFNAIITDAHTEGEKRGYKKPYSATAIAYEDSEKSLESLVDVVSKKGFALSQKFYQAKAKLHGVETLNYAERNAQIGEDIAIPWEQALDICRDVFYKLSPQYGEIFDSMLRCGQIDVFPRPGKQGGAFMSDQTGHPIQVMLNHTPTFMALETLAHEMGHAIHATRSTRTQSSFYDGHSTITAETASTLFENLVFDAVFAVAEPNVQTQLLHDRLIRDVSTIQRQIAFFNMELEIHNQIITNGAITNNKLRDITTKNLKQYLGKAINVTENDGYSYVYISHLRYGFYVYTYTFGLLMSSIMSERYKADNNYIESIDIFLCSGASASVADIFDQIGIDTRHEDTFKNALLAHQKTVDNFVKLVNKQIK